MQFKPNTFNSDIETVAKVKPDAHYLLNDIAKKVLSEKELSTEEMEQIANIYSELGELDPNLVSYLSELENKNRITQEEKNIVTCYFLIAKQVGPSSDYLRNTIYNNTSSNETDVLSLIKNISIPEHTASVLRDVLQRLVKDQDLVKKQALQKDVFML